MKILVWGISRTLKELEKKSFLLDEKNVLGYIDNDERWTGNKYKGKLVLKSNEIESHKDSFDFIFISTPKYQAEIIKEARKLGFENRILPVEIAHPFIELHFNHILETVFDTDEIQIIKNWYVEKNGRSIIIQVANGCGKRVRLRVFPKWCLGDRYVPETIKIINLQNGFVEHSGTTDIEKDIILPIHNDLTLLKITKDGLNSCFLSAERIPGDAFLEQDASVLERSSAAYSALLRERSYNYDYTWHEFDYEFLEHIHLPEKFTILDIGANLGQSAENFLEHTSADVVLMEANPAYKKVLELWERAYPGRCRALPCGVGRDAGNLDFYVPKFESDIAQESSFYRERAVRRVENVLGVHITKDNWEEYIERQEVEVISVDSLIDSYRYPVFFIKIDVESYEYQVMLGMEGSIQRYKPIILLEFNSEEQKNDILDFANKIFPYHIRYWDYINSKFAKENYCCSNNYFLIPEGFLEAE